jgi:hypothetical protein
LLSPVLYAARNVDSIALAPERCER